MPGTLGDETSTGTTACVRKHHFCVASMLETAVPIGRGKRTGATARSKTAGAGPQRPRRHTVRETPETVSVPGTLWGDDPLDDTDSGGNPDGTETQAP